MGNIESDIKVKNDCFTEQLDEHTQKINDNTNDIKFLMNIVTNILLNSNLKIESKKPVDIHGILDQKSIIESNVETFTENISQLSSITEKINKHQKLISDVTDKAYSN